jgi:tRNA(adenine34) deaminase
VNYEPLMQLALAQAKLAIPEVPVGAVLCNAQGEILAVGYNQKEQKSDPTSHAEIEVIREASKLLGDWRLANCTLIVTLEPCAMCAGAIMAARIPRVVFGAWDDSVGAAGSAYDLLRDQRLGVPVEVIPGVLEKECSELLSNFFRTQR